MPPVIPSPTPITGVKVVGGKPAQRLPIDVFRIQHEFAFALYVKALSAWQKNGNEKFDQDNVNGTSYFQVSGVHGVPYVAWQKDPTTEVAANVGYCTHRSVLFIPWHRPYMMLYEQIIFAYAQEIVSKATGFAADAYRTALQDVRLPYWDWASDPHLPAVTMSPDITLTFPGKTSGSKEILHLSDNPLYSYRFTSPWAKTTMQNQMQWPSTPAWEASKRCPDANGNNHPEIANAQIAAVAKTFKTSIFDALTNVTNFDQFTTQAWRPKQPVKAYSSVEGMHNTIHDYIGTNNTASEAGGQWGNMTDVQASSFDPIFWLHHVNCDRLTALWQAVNPNCTIDEYPSLMDRFVMRNGAMEGGKSSLEPWHRGSAHSMGDYYVANDTKELISTFDGGYYYPETPLDLLKKPDQMKAYVTQQVYKLYAPSSLQPTAHKLVGIAPTSGKPIEASSTKENITRDSHEIKQWNVFLRVKNFALTGTWGIHVFLGKVPASSADWLLSENRIGTVTMLSNRSRENCANCVAQAEEGILVTGSVPLNEALGERQVDIGNTAAVVAYLKENLSWRVVKDTQDIPITGDFALAVGVSAQSLSIPGAFRELPTWGRCEVFPEATTGKVGGLSEQNREELKL
ncbi:hypothetical protein KVR01_011832 [Diaporthe batatas]|uniref:uncharacterized protein n=1 Tax=Diaporthe batatas TaxID=748121 RepID=UPI001D040CD7|nr:uncharacterized protein KVR01_011832 [Diaporthe batatas]KAG8158071.1 hypothetical protein KVR01_011832 [Diaporthe batatas]